MSTLEKVMLMKKQGIPEEDIIETLKSQGVPPKEIEEAISQSKIKSAIADSPLQDTNIQTPEIPLSEYTSPPNIPENEQFQASPQTQPPQPSPQISEQEYPPETPPETPSPPYDTQYSQQQYPEYYPQYYPEAPGLDINTIKDLTEQIVEEKIAKLRDSLSALKKFKEEISFEIKRIAKKLEKIEDNFNTLQISIIKKIGSYGESIKNIEKEMHATQESFSKILNPLTDNIRELEKIKKTKSSKTSKEKKKENKKEKSKHKHHFESYLKR